MARARNIKPGFFQNEKLAELEPLARILFAGLWTLADRAGRLEDRPKRIRNAVLGYDDCDVDSMLQALHDAGFIQRYSSNEFSYIQIVTWEKHQNPHVREPESTIPAPDKHSAGTVLGTEKAVPSTEPARLIPSSSSPDSSSPDSSRTPSPLTGSEISTSPATTDCAGAAPEKNARSTKTRGTQLPDSFTPTDAHMVLATQLGVQISEELPAFLDFHASKGTVFKDWNRGFCTWLRNAKKFNGGKIGKRYESTADRRAAWLAELYASSTPAGTVDGTAERLD